jgi:hypothetical protein
VLLFSRNMFDVEKLCQHVESLPEWDPMKDDDPNWVFPAKAFGWVNPMKIGEATPYLEYCAGLDFTLDRVMEIDPNWVAYSGQQYIRLDAVYHYLTFSDLFDQEGLFDNDLPVIAEWDDAYVVFDGNHRLTADKLLGRRSTVYFVSSPRK